MRVYGLRRPYSHWSLRARVTVMAAVVVGSLLIAGVVAFYFVIRATVQDGLHDRGYAAADELADLVRQSEPRGVLASRDVDFSLLQIVDARSGRVLAMSEALVGRGPLDVGPIGPDGRSESADVLVPGVADDAYVVTLRVQAAEGPRIVHAGTPLTALKQNKVVFIGGLVSGVVLVTAGLAWGVWQVVRRALGPVRVMSAELAEITGGKPQGRVTVPGSRDEVAELAESVNLTLRRLEGTVERHRAFVADASHELRSPLTGLRAQLEVALEHPENEDWPAVAQSALGDAYRLQRIVSDLLVLAKLDAGVPMDREPVDLGELARAEAARAWRGVPITVVAQDRVVVLGTRPHLMRVLVNLLDNAGRHARSRVWVTVATEGRDAVLEVVDDGSGIPPEDRERVFWRFQRLSEGLDRDRAGSGLGLAISRDIATAHGGTLVAEEGGTRAGFGVGDAEGVREAGGARLVLRLPLYEADNERRPD